MKIFLLFFFAINILFANDLKVIENYKILHKNIYYKNLPYTLIRSFHIDNKSYFLAVNDNTLKTEVIVNEKFSKRKKSNTRYNSLLINYTKPPFLLQNFGVNSLNSKDIFLTMDMCPSSKIGYEDGFLAQLISHYSKYKAVPITLFVSGRWIKKHQNDFLELLLLQKEKKLDITWGNHTYNHFYFKNCPLDKNFILASKTNLKSEVLELEKLLLSFGVTPSILFRFPGLISNQKSVDFLKNSGLIPIGSNAWLAKDEKIKKGSIVLVHGNKNEPKGIEKAKNLLIKREDFILGSLLDEL